MLSTLAAVSALIYWEQTALLYALSTLAMCILLLVVAFSNIEGRDREVNQMNKRMKVLIGYDGSGYSDAAIDDLRRAGLPSEVEALVVSVGDSPIIPPLASHKVIEKAFVGERVVSIVEHANRQTRGFKTGKRIRPECKSVS